MTTDRSSSAHAPNPEAALFAALRSLDDRPDLERMLDHVCEAVLGLGDFGACVLGFYTPFEAGYGVAGNVPVGTRGRFYQSFRASTPEGRAHRRNELLAHRRPGTNISFMPTGSGPEPSTAFAPTLAAKAGTWDPHDRLMIIQPCRAGDDPLWISLSLDQPSNGNRPDEATFRRLEAVERFLTVAAVYIENLLLGARLRDQTRTFEQVLAALPATVALVDAHGTILYTNLAGTGDPTRPPLGSEGQSVRDLAWSATARDGVARLLDKGAPLAALDAELVHAGRSWRVILSGAPAASGGGAGGASVPRHKAVLVATDAGEFQAHQAEALESKKMRAVGRLAGGVAHEFNNLLTAVLGGVDLARARLADGAPPGVTRLLDDAFDAASRGGVLTRQLLAFARPTRTGFTHVDLRALAGEALEQTRAGADARIKMEISGGDPAMALGDPALLREAIASLCRNACDALVQRLRRETPDDVWQPTVAITVGSAAPGGFHVEAVEVQVHDNGGGMDQATLDRVFEPFFSGSDATDRAGLGLAMTYGVVSQHGGTIQGQSSQAAGTTFTIRLPSVEQPAARTTRRPQKLAAGDGRVLIVDDQAVVRRALASLIELYGYEPVTVVNGTEAVDALKGGSDQFVAVLLDYAMPDMNGREVLEELHVLGVEVPPVVIVTGDLSRVEVEDLDDLGVRAVLAKPCRGPALRATLLEVTA